jgi:hypothetical protein
MIAYSPKIAVLVIIRKTLLQLLKCKNFIVRLKLALWLAYNNTIISQLSNTKYFIE